MPKQTTNQSATKVLDVLDVLLRNFANGLTPTELCSATKLSPSNITRYVETLVQRGFAERIPETNRIRASHRLANHAVNIMRDLEQAQNRITESLTRITREAQ